MDTAYIIEVALDYISMLNTIAEYCRAFALRWIDTLVNDTIR